MEKPSSSCLHGVFLLQYDQCGRVSLRGQARGQAGWTLHVQVGAKRASICTEVESSHRHRTCLTLKERLALSFTFIQMFCEPVKTVKLTVSQEGVKSTSVAQMQRA